MTHYVNNIIYSNRKFILQTHRDTTVCPFNMRINTWNTQYRQ